MKFRKLLSLGLCAAMVASLAVGCGTKDSKDDKGSVYYLSFKPESTKQ